MVKNPIKLSNIIRGEFPLVYVLCFLCGYCSIEAFQRIERREDFRPAACRHPSYVQLDITNEQLVKRTIEELKPDVIIHCAAWTAVDAAEDPGNKDKVHKINAEGTAYIAEAAKAVDAKMVYISTDYVFDGQGERPWQPDDKDYAPLNYYGQTKLEGEMAVAENLDKFFIVRIAWVFGLNGKNFIKTMINVGKTHDTVAQQQASHQRLQL